VERRREFGGEVGQRTLSNLVIDRVETGRFDFDADLVGSGFGDLEGRLREDVRIAVLLDNVGGHLNGHNGR